MKILKTILFLFISIAAWSQQDSIVLDTLQIPSEIFIDKPVKPDELGKYPYPRPIESYDGVEVRFLENKKVTKTIYYVALIDPKNGQLKYQEIQKSDFKLIKAKELKTYMSIK